MMATRACEGPEGTELKLSEPLDNILTWAPSSLCCGTGRR